MIIIATVLVLYDRRRQELTYVDSGVEPTVPSIEDPTSPAWAETNILLSELAINIADSRIWFRDESGIVEIATQDWVLDQGVGGGSDTLVDTTLSLGGDTDTIVFTELIALDITKVHIWLNNLKIPLKGRLSKLNTYTSLAGSIKLNGVVFKNTDEILIKYTA